MINGINNHDQVNLVKDAILDAGVLIDGHFVFAEGRHSLQKLEMDNLWLHDKSLGLVLGEMKKEMKKQNFDIVSGVPTGGMKLAEKLVESKSDDEKLIILKRIPGKGKRDYDLLNPDDRYFLKKAKSILIIEDVVSSLGSVAAVVKLLRKFTRVNVEIHSLAIWRREEVNPEYGQEIFQHYLVEEAIPSFDKNDCPYPDCR